MLFNTTVHSRSALLRPLLEHVTFWTLAGCLAGLFSTVSLGGVVAIGGAALTLDVPLDAVDLDSWAEGPALADTRGFRQGETVAALHAGVYPPAVEEAGRALLRLRIMVLPEL